MTKNKQLREIYGVIFEKPEFMCAMQEDEVQCFPEIANLGQHEFTLY
jgi:hypothetical protein